MSKNLTYFQATRVTESNELTRVSWAQHTSVSLVQSLLLGTHPALEPCCTAYWSPVLWHSSYSGNSSGSLTPWLTLPLHHLVLWILVWLWLASWLLIPGWTSGLVFGFWFDLWSPVSAPVQFQILGFGPDLLVWNSDHLQLLLVFSVSS